MPPDLDNLTRARTACAELEREFGHRPQFDTINDALRNVETALQSPIVTDEELTTLNALRDGRLIVAEASELAALRAQASSPKAEGNATP